MNTRRTRLDMVAVFNARANGIFISVQDGFWRKFFLARDSDSTFLARHSEPTLLTRHSDPNFLAHHSDPNFLARHSETTFLTRHSDLIFFAQHSDPIFLAWHSDLTLFPRHSVSNFLGQHSDPNFFAQHSDPAFLAWHSDPAFLFEGIKIHTPFSVLVNLWWKLLVKKFRKKITQLYIFLRINSCLLFFKYQIMFLIILDSKGKNCLQLD